MTPAQLSTLKAYILADSAFQEMALTGQYQQVANAMNLQASPAFTAWKKRVDTPDVGRTVLYGAVGALTTVNTSRIDLFYAMNPVSFEPRLDIRTFFDATFSGALAGEGQATRDALTALWKRLATRFEKVLATGTGSDASPATMGAEGPMVAQDVGDALSAA